MQLIIHPATRQRYTESINAHKQRHEGTVCPCGHGRSTRSSERRRPLAKLRRHGTKTRSMKKKNHVPSKDYAMSTTHAPLSCSQSQAMTPPCYHTRHRIHRFTFSYTQSTITMQFHEKRNRPTTKHDCRKSAHNSRNAKYAPAHPGLAPPVTHVGRTRAHASQIAMAAAQRLFAQGVNSDDIKHIHSVVTHTADSMVYLQHCHHQRHAGQLRQVGMRDHYVRHNRYVNRPQVGPE